MSLVYEEVKNLKPDYFDSPQMPVSENMAVTCCYRVLSSDKIPLDFQRITGCNTR